jgi:hypothetical protein
VIIGRAVDVWVPLDLLDACFPARRLTIDVEQRLHALRNEYGGYSPGLNEAIKEASFAAYAEEKSKAPNLSRYLDGWKNGLGAPRNASGGSRPRHGFVPVLTSVNSCNGIVDTHWSAKR